MYWLLTLCGERLAALMELCARPKGYAGDRGGDTDGTRMSPISLQSTVRRIRRGGGVKSTCRRWASCFRWIAISIRVVVGAVRRNIFARRLRELPSVTKLTPLPGGSWRTLRKCTSG